MQPATAPSYASWLNVPSVMLPPSSTIVTLCAYEPLHVADWISCARYSASGRHAPVPHAAVSTVPNWLYAQSTAAPLELTRVENMPAAIRLYTSVAAAVIALVTTADASCGGAKPTPPLVALSMKLPPPTVPAK